MGQINFNNQKPKYCNLQAIQSGGSKANYPIPNGEVWMVDNTNSSKPEDGTGKYDSYIVGDGTTIASELVVHNIEDKEYDSTKFSGLGKKVLPKNIVSNKNVLTQAMVNTANTIYHIQYDYDLNGQTITLPAGCVLEFAGGSLVNGSVIGNFSVIGNNVAQMSVFPNGYNLSGGDEMLVAEKIGMIPNDQTKSSYNASILDSVILKKKGISFHDVYYIGNTTQPIDFPIELKNGTIYVQGNIFLTLTDGGAIHCENIDFKGIQDLQNSVKCNIIRDASFALLIDEISFCGCSFDSLAPLYIKSVDADYGATPIGIKSFSVQNCTFSNTHMNIFTLHDVVFEKSFMAQGNIVNDLCGVCFDLTKTNGYNDNTDYQADVVVEGNTFIGIPSDYVSYITPLLAETNRVIYRNNIAKNIIGCHYNAYPYDAYVSSKEYYCENNSFTNIGKIVPNEETVDNNTTFPEIFKSKGGGGIRVARNNTWNIDFSEIRSFVADAGTVISDARFAECNRIDIFKPTSQLSELIFSGNKVTITNGRLGYPTSRIMAYEIQINDNMFIVDGAEGTAFVVVADNSTLINILRNYIYAKSNIFHVVKEVANSSTAQVVVKNNIIYPYMPTNLCVDFQKFICEENICLGFPSAVSQGTLNLYKQKSDSVVESYLSANDVNIRSVDNTKHRIFFNKESGSMSFSVKTNCFIECQSDKGNFKLRIVNDAMYDEWGNQLSLTSSYYGFLNDVSIRKVGNLDYTISFSNAPKGIITFSDLKYYGGELQRTNRNYGEYEFDIDNTRPKWWCKGKYVNALGNDASAATSGISTSRPSSSLITAGFQYYDTTLGKPIWYNGSGWVDATGAAV